MVEKRRGWGKERKLAGQAQTGCSIQTRSAGRSRGSSGVAGTSAAAAAAVAAEGTSGVVVVVAAAAAVDVTILLAVGQVGAELVVVPVILAVDATIQPVVEPIVLAWPLVGPVAAKD